VAVSPARPERVALLATCLVDQLYPEVGLATLRVLARHGVAAEFPPAQTCCGQPLFNMGHHEQARALAQHTLSVFEAYDAVVVPSGSCAAMVKVFYPDLFAPEHPVRARLAALAARTYELSQFLVERLGVTDVGACFDGSVTYHDGCHALRELRVRAAPRLLLGSVAGCRLVEMNACDACCGFGGTFSVKFPEISSAMVGDKLAAIEASGADVVVSTDASCLMQIRGAAQRAGSRVRALHLAELLAGEPGGDEP
jgi:L-lactate dehydrogenase complex protein LldE